MKRGGQEYDQVIKETCRWERFNNVHQVKNEATGLVEKTPQVRLFRREKRDTCLPVLPCEAFVPRSRHAEDSPK